MSKTEKTSDNHEKIYNASEYLPPRASNYRTFEVIDFDSDEMVYYDYHQKAWLTVWGDFVDVERWKFGEPIKVNQDPKHKLFSHMSDEHGVILTDGELWDIINIVRELDKEDKTAHQLAEELKQLQYEKQQMESQFTKVIETLEELLTDQFSICELRDVWRKRAGLVQKCEEEESNLKECMAGRDGECNHPNCPVSEEDVKNGNYCKLPLYDHRH